jgi:hypothetical protein
MVRHSIARRGWIALASAKEVEKADTTKLPPGREATDETLHNRKAFLVRKQSEKIHIRLRLYPQNAKLNLLESPAWHYSQTSLLIRVLRVSGLKIYSFFTITTENLLFFTTW